MARKTRGKGWEFIPANPKPVKYQRNKSEAPESQKIKVKEERRNRGKTVTVCSGFKLTTPDLKKLAKSLKATCGSGGTANQAENAKDTGSIEVQGQHVDKVKSVLADLGYLVQ